jgi:hypothetical protein
MSGGKVADNRTISPRAYWSLLAVFIAAYLVRITGAPLPDVIASHISNFALTGALVMGAGYVLFRKRGYTTRRLLLELAPFAALNIIIELFVDSDLFRFLGVDIGNFNTADPWDIAGGLLALALIAVVASLEGAKRQPK